MSKPTKKKTLNVCETCLELFDDYSINWVDREAGYRSLHCDSCCTKHDLPIVRRMKEKKIKK